MDPWEACEKVDGDSSIQTPGARLSHRIAFCFMKSSKGGVVFCQLRKMPDSGERDAAVARTALGFNSRVAE